MALHLFSESFIPTRKEIPAGADIPSHRLMLQAGIIHQEAAGLHTFLPMGVRVLKRITHIIDREMEAIRCSRLSMPILQPGELWRRSGRYESYGLEMLRMKDRHLRELVFSPTNEEMVTAMMADYLHSYRDLPKSIYQIQWKFRDEIRPRFGLMRGREFLMKDGYSLDVDADAAQLAYALMFKAYLNIMRSMDLEPLPLRADSGPIGGYQNHEFVILSDKGETKLFADRRILDLSHEKNPEDPLAYMHRWNPFYAVTKDVHEEHLFLQVPEKFRIVLRGIEVGHLFNFGQKYSKAMDMTVTDRHGQPLYPHMGSYGIGVSRLAAALVEVHHDEHGICWPISAAPYDVEILPLGRGAPKDKAMEVASLLRHSGLDVLLDDRDIHAGEKLMDADLIGIPHQIRIGSKSLPQVEWKKRAGGAIRLLAPEDLPKQLHA